MSHRRTIDQRPHAHIADEYTLQALELGSAHTEAHRDRLLAAAEVHATLALADQVEQLHRQLRADGLLQTLELLASRAARDAPLTRPSPRRRARPPGARRRLSGRALPGGERPRATSA